MSRTNFSTDTRGASSTIGFILILTIIVLTAGMLVGVGSSIMSESQQAANEETIDQGMTQLDSQMSLVAFEGGSEQTVNLAAGSDEQLTIEDAGHITLELKAINESDPTETETIETVLDRDLHALEYQSGDRTVAYQGGGVWAVKGDDPDTAEMISPPEFSYDSNTATLPFVSVTQDDDFISSNGEITMTRGESTGLFPDSENENLTNPVDPEHDLVLTIQGDYYQGWGQFFENRMGVNPGYDHDANEVEITLVTEGDEQTVTTAVTSVGGDNRIELRGQGTSTIVDSYNSNEGSYESSYSQNGSIHSTSGVMIDNGMVRGSVFTEGDLVMRGNAHVTGDAHVDGNYQTRGGSDVGGTVTPEADVEGFTPIDTIIESIREELVEENDNNDNTQISDGEITTDRVLDTQNSETTIHSGDYYLSEFSPDDDVRFDLSDGSIKIMVDEEIDLTSSDVTVENIPAGSDHRVEIYTRSDSIDLSSVMVEGDRAPAMWFYGGAGTDIDIHSSGDGVTGVLYAPGTSEIPGDVTVHSHAELFGASVGGNTEVQNQATYHYDEALRETPVFTEAHHLDQISAVISYFHISYTEIEIED